MISIRERDQQKVVDQSREWQRWTAPEDSRTSVQRARATPRFHQAPGNKLFRVTPPGYETAGLGGWFIPYTIAFSHTTARPEGLPKSDAHARLHTAEVGSTVHTHVRLSYFILPIFILPITSPTCSWSGDRPPFPPAPRSLGRQGRPRSASAARTTRWCRAAPRPSAAAAPRASVPTPK